MSADMFIHCVKKQVIVDDKDIGLPCAPYNNAFSANEYADHVKIIFTYETITIPKTLVEVSYQINSNGEILVENLFHGRPGTSRASGFWTTYTYADACKGI